MSVPIRTQQKLHDPIARAHRRAAVLRSVAYVAVALVVLGGLCFLGWRIVRHRTQAPAAVGERTPQGIWCRGQDCQYFDRSGERWGSAIFSHGPLLLLVQDERTDATGAERLIPAMFTAVDALPNIELHARSVTFPDSAPGDMRITTDKGYDIIFDAYGDITDQLSTLSVLLADRTKDPAWSPQYIDLRTPGRVYYR
jgi:cell division septal protein FtsQ